MRNGEDWASQTIDSHDEDIDRGKGCNEQSDGGDEDGDTAQQKEKPSSCVGRKTKAEKGD